MDNLNVLIGLKIVAVKGRIGDDKRLKPAKYGLSDEPRFIFFDDGLTFIELEEQDYYAYHDCASSARFINVHQDREQYQNMLTWEKLVNVV